MATTNTPMNFSAIGAVFNDATNRLEGGVTVANQEKILSDLQSVQTNLAALIKAQPDLFTGVTAIHAQAIVDQINLETGAIHALGTDPFAAKEINDIHRDLIDIVQGDNNLVSLSNQHGSHGFAAVPAPLAPPSPFHDSAAQTVFLHNFAADAQSLSGRAIAAVGTAAAADVAHDIQAFVASANAFVNAPEQAGLYSARFANEIGTNGVNGTVSHALIHALETGDVAQVHVAATALTANVLDVQGNNLTFGANAPTTTNPIPAEIINFAQAGTVFNDATVKLIGGIFDGAASNRQVVLSDLGATKAGLEGLLNTQSANFQSVSGHHIQTIIGDLAKEMALVSAAGTGVADTNQIGALQKDIISIVQHDKVLAAMATADGANGFMALPAKLHPAANHGGDVEHSMASMHGHDGAAHDPAAHAFVGHDPHLFG